MIKLREKIAYGFGDMSSSMFWKIIGMYMLFFYTDVFGLSPVAVGTMFLLTRIWDTVNDPIMGMIADRTHTRWGHFRPYLLWGAFPFAAIGILAFTTPDLAPGWRLVYAYVTYTLLMMIYTMVNVPYASMLGVMSSDPGERNILSSYRMFFAYLVSFIAIGLAEPLVNFFSDCGGVRSSARGWQYMMVVIGVVCAVLFFLCFKWTRERITVQSAKKTTIGNDLKDLLVNRPWWILLGAGVAALLFNSIRDGATIYYFKYYIQGGRSFGSLFGGLFTLSSFYLMLGQVSNMVGVVLASPLSNRFGKKTTYIGAMAIACVLSLVFHTFTPDQLFLIFVFQALISICAGCIFPLLWSMYADIADYSEWRTGRRATGLIFSSSSMSQKLGWTLGGAVTGWLLGYYGFQANEVQSEEAVRGIRMMLSYLPAVGAFLSVILIGFYPLNERRVTAISRTLRQGRKESD
ncbi:MFS transporter [Alistipes megaguti]|uniref:MFS transporter n=1 Tax=Alistipes megaguti TaxID=2364787 RepID=UPI0023532322|nr:MFS transporter [Alistipes megaguti]